MQKTIGESGHICLQTTSTIIPALRSKLTRFRNMGFVSHETYVIWRNAEKQPGVWDWGHYDAYADAYTSAGMKWVPFLITGPAYSLPKWFYNSPAHRGYRCLEHNEETGIQTLWDPDWPPRVEEFLTRFAERYKNSGLIESVLIGVTGNYGEAIYPASDGDWWTSWANGVYHSHGGMWCGDPYARAEFRKWLEGKYTSLSSLNQAWSTQHANWSDINPEPNPQRANKRPWLDTLDWYREAMNRWIEFWLQAVRERLPDTPVYLCTGGHAPPEQGCEMAIQSKLAAKHGAGIRITNEGSDYVVNFAYTRWVGSSARHYGTFFGYEPASAVDPKGTVARVYNAVCSGAAQIHCYDYNFDNAASIANWNRYRSLLQVRHPKIDVAVWYPNRAVDLRRHDIQVRLREMRKVCDYDIVDDQMLRDGALDKYRILVCLSDGPYERATLQAISNWLGANKRLYIPKAAGFSIKTIEGDLAFDTAWRKNGAVHWLDTPANLTGYYSALAQTLPQAGVLVTGIPNVFATEFEDGGAMLLNLNDTTQTITLGFNGIRLSPVSITEMKSLKAGTRVDFQLYE